MSCIQCRASQHARIVNNKTEVGTFVKISMILRIAYRVNVRKVHACNDGNRLACSSGKSFSVFKGFNAIYLINSVNAQRRIKKDDDPLT